MDTVEDRHEQLSLRRPLRQLKRHDHYVARRTTLDPIAISLARSMVHYLRRRAGRMVALRRASHKMLALRSVAASRNYLEETLDPIANAK